MHERGHTTVCRNRALQTAVRADMLRDTDQSGRIERRVHRDDIRTASHRECRRHQERTSRPAPAANTAHMRDSRTDRVVAIIENHRGESVVAAGRRLKAAEHKEDRDGISAVT